MASQSIIAVSPDGRYVAAQVHHLVQVVEQSTGKCVGLPAPVFSLVADTADDAEADAAAAADRGDAPEEGAEGGADDESADKDGKKAKKAKIAADKAAASKGGQRSHEGPKPVRVLTFHPRADQPWFMYNSDEKYIHLYHRSDSYESGFKHVLTVVIPRKVQTAVFHPLRFAASSTHMDPAAAAGASRPLLLPQLIVADKTGDVFTLSGTDLATQTLEMGHLANMTHMQFYEAPAGASAALPADQQPNAPSAAADVAVPSRARNYLLTSDSDGKIRVSNSPNFFDIQAFCLGHQAFVSLFVVLPLATPLIVSGGLGSELFLWNLATGTKLAAFDLAAHRSDASAAAASAPATSSVLDAAAQGCYISSISLANTSTATLTEGEFTMAVAVYPWSQLFMLTYSPANESSPFIVTSVLSTPSTPMCVSLVGASSAPAASYPPRVWYIDQQLEVHALRRGTNCGQWKDASASGDHVAAVQAALASFSTGFASARANLSDTLITEANAGDFIGSGTRDAKNEPQTAAQEERAAAAAAAGNSGRYISPFSSTSHSSHLQRLGLLTASGFAFRRFFDKMQREKFVAGKRAEAAARREGNKKQKAANKAANQRQKREEGDMEEGGQNEH